MTRPARAPHPCVGAGVMERHNPTILDEDVVEGDGDLPVHRWPIVPRGGTTTGSPYRPMSSP
jgi:hypothetical protein